MKKRIYIITTSDISYQQPLIRTANSLQRAGYKVKLIGRKLPTSISLSGYSFQHLRLSCIFNTTWLFYFEFNVRVFFCLLFSRQDAICAVDLDTALAVLFISRVKRVPRVYDARELFTEMKTVIDRPAIQKTWLRIEKYALPKFPWGYVVSKSIGDELNKRYGITYPTIRNIPILKDNEPQKDQVENPYILYQGYIHEERGIEPLIIAMQQVSMKLVLCGTGNIYDKCIKLAREVGLTERILFKGLVPPEQLTAFTKNAFIGVNLVEPSGLNQLYSLTNKYFDYIHAELPQITMNFPEYQRVNNEYEVALLIDNLQPETIAKAIHLLVTDKHLYNKLRDNCKKARQALNWQNEEKKLVEFYQMVLK